MGRDVYNGGMLVGLTVGLFAGLAVGFLYAPRSGKDTQQLLREKVEGCGNKAAEVLYRAKDVIGMRLLDVPDYSTSGDL